MTVIAPQRPTAMGAWVDRAACRGTDTDLFYPTGPTPDGRIAEASVAPAARVCAACPVRAECLDDARVRGDRHGIRAATTPAERRRGLDHLCTECGVASPRPVCRCCAPEPPAALTTTKRKKEGNVISDPSKLEFTDTLPDRHHGRIGRHQALAAALRKNAGRWAPIASYTKPATAQALASDVRTGRRRPAYAPVGTYQAEVRQVGEAWLVYARYAAAEGRRA